jgi:hypothetical protein
MKITKEMWKDVENDLYELKGKRCRGNVNNREQWEFVIKKSKAI